jgi:putative transposase
MTCAHGASTASTERAERTELGYHGFRCRDCQREFNERTGTPFNRLHYPTDLICLVVFRRFRYTWSLRNLAEMFPQRGMIFTHEAVRRWETKLTPHLMEALRKKAVAPSVLAGMWMRRLSRSKGSGTTSIVPLPLRRRVYTPRP